MMMLSQVVQTRRAEMARVVNLHRRHAGREKGVTVIAHHQFGFGLSLVGALLHLDQRVEVELVLFIAVAATL
jgi:hypothetical protein